MAAYIPQVNSISRITPQTNTTNGAPCILDPASLPTIVDNIIEHSDTATRHALWSTSRALNFHLNSHFYHRAIIGCGGLMTDNPNGFPTISKGMHERQLESQMNFAIHGHMIDLVAQCTTPLADLVLETALAGKDTVTLRSWHTTDFYHIHHIPSTLILTYASEPLLSISIEETPFLPFPLPEGPERIVFNMSYTWADRVFALDCDRNDRFPDSVKEVVFHFKRADNSPRPRYQLCEIPLAHLRPVDHDGSCDILKSFTATCPVPTLANGDQHLHIVRTPVPKNGVGLFAHIAEMYANSIGKGKRKNRALKLTLVGLEEFDAARDEDAAGDAAFEAVVNDLPWGELGVPARAQYARRPYTPVASDFVEMVIGHVHKSKHERVQRNVRLMSSADYLAEIGPHRRKEELWWANLREGGEMSIKCK